LIVYWKEASVKVFAEKFISCPPGTTSSMAMSATLLGDYPVTTTSHATPYLVEPVGGHTGYHIVESLLLAWPSIKADFSRSVQDPVQFSYRTIEPRFSVWNWDFAVKTRDG